MLVMLVELGKQIVRSYTSGSVWR